MARPKGIPAHNIKSEIGNRYGKLLVVSRASPDKYGRAMWNCKCDCGVDKTTAGFKLRGRELQSCGCYRRELTRNLKLLSPEERERRRTQPRECTRCHNIQPPEQFGHINRTQCKTCRSEIQQEWRLKDENGIKANWKKKYDMTMEDYMAMLKAQDGKCAICRRPKPNNMKYFRIDHCHKPGKKKRECVRGLLCHGCNTAIGILGDDIPFIKSALKYLENYYGLAEIS